MGKKKKGGKQKKAPEPGLSLEEFLKCLKTEFSKENVEPGQQRIFLDVINNQLETREKETSPLQLCICDGLESHCIQVFCQVLRKTWKKKFNILKVLCIVNAEIDDNAANELGRCMKEVGSLCRIDLKRCLISSHSCEIFGNGILRNSQALKTLKEIDLSYNEFGTNGIAQIANALNGNHSLEKLTLDFCGITPDAGEFFIAILGKSPLLKKLSLEGNNLRSYGLHCICYALLNSTTILQNLNFSLNHFGEVADETELNHQAIEQLCMAMEHITTLKEINICGNSISEEYGAQLINSYKESKIEKLKIPFNWSNVKLYDDIQKIASKRGGKKKKGKKKGKGKKKKK